MDQRAKVPWRDPARSGPQPVAGAPRHDRSLAEFHARTVTWHDRSVAEVHARTVAWRDRSVAEAHARALVWRGRSVAELRAPTGGRARRSRRSGLRIAP